MNARRVGPGMANLDTLGRVNRFTRISASNSAFSSRNNPNATRELATIRQGARRRAIVAAGGTYRG